MNRYIKEMNSPSSAAEYQKLRVAAEQIISVDTEQIHSHEISFINTDGSMAVLVKVIKYDAASKKNLVVGTFGPGDKSLYKLKYKIELLSLEEDLFIPDLHNFNSPEQGIYALEYSNEYE